MEDASVSAVKDKTGQVAAGNDGKNTINEGGPAVGGGVTGGVAHTKGVKVGGQYPIKKDFKEDGD